MSICPISDAFKVLLHQHVSDFADGYDVRDLYKNLKAILKTMTENERRTHIDEDLIIKLDGNIYTKGTRATYGAVGREVGDVETSDEAEEDEDEA